MLASPEGHSFPHIMPICHSAQLDPLISVSVRIGVEHREEHLPYWARVSFESRRNPEQIAQPLWRRDMQIFNLLKWEPDILVVDNDLKKGRQQIVAIAPLREGLSPEAPLKERLGTLRFVQERHSLCWLMVAELV